MIENYYLQETYNVKDLFKLEALREEFIIYLNNIEHSGMLGVIGNAGSGKSVFMKDIRKAISSDKTMVCNFEARKYPGKKELWECFILSLGEQIFDDYERYLASIDGGKSIELKALEAAAETTGGVVNLMTQILTLGKISPEIKISKFLEMFEERPAKRYFELEKVFDGLVQMIQGMKLEKLYIIIEDADRADDDGRYFMETLNAYLTDYRDSGGDDYLTIVPIVLINNHSISLDLDKSWYKYIKIFDYTWEYKPNINRTKFAIQLFPYEPKEIIEIYVQYLNILTKRGFSIREIKFILRQTYRLLLIDGVNLDPAIFMILQSNRFFTKTDEGFRRILFSGNVEKSKFRSIRKHPSVSHGMNGLPQLWFTHKKKGIIALDHLIKDIIDIRNSNPDHSGSYRGINFTNEISNSDTPKSYSTDELFYYYKLSTRYTSNYKPKS